MKTIRLDKFKPRSYQENFISAFESGKYKRYLLIWPRRSGKDICALNMILRAALRRVGTYIICLQTYSAARKILWDAIDTAGNKIMSYYIPDEIVVSRNEMQMRVKLINGSQIQLVGSDNVDNTLVGMSIHGIIYSEYALQHERAFQLVIPILQATDGFAAFVSTPRGKSFFYDMYQMALKRDDWFCERLSVEDTQHLSLDEIEHEIDSGQISRELARQEYWCDFDALGVEGSFYGPAIDLMYKQDRISSITHDPSKVTHTVWDLGFNDKTVIIWFQVVGGMDVRIIDYYENSQQSLEHYIQYVRMKEKEWSYTYGYHIAPHDINVHEFSSGTTRRRAAADLGFNFMLWPHERSRYSNWKHPSIEVGIELVRRLLPRTYIDELRCKKLIKALENYRQEYDPVHQVYSSKPLHDHNSHAADAMRYLAVGLNFINGRDSTPEEIDQRYKKAMYGAQSNLPEFFR